MPRSAARATIPSGPDTVFGGALAHRIVCTCPPLGYRAAPASDLAMPSPVWRGIEPYLRWTQGNSLLPPYSPINQAPIKLGGWGSVHVDAHGEGRPMGTIRSRSDLDLPAVAGTLRCGSRRATFLPQVWSQLSAPRDFVCQLKRKAGLLSYPPEDLQFWRYTTESFSQELLSGSSLRQ